MKIVQLSIGGMEWNTIQALKGMRLGLLVKKIKQPRKPCSVKEGNKKSYITWWSHLQDVSRLPLLFSFVCDLSTDIIVPQCFILVSLKIWRLWISEAVVLGEAWNSKQNERSWLMRHRGAVSILRLGIQLWAKTRTKVSAYISVGKFLYIGVFVICPINS